MNRVADGFLLNVVLERRGGGCDEGAATAAAAAALAAGHDDPVAAGESVAALFAQEGVPPILLAAGRFGNAWADATLEIPHNH